MNTEFDFDFLKSALRTIELEQRAIHNLSAMLDSNFITACQLMLSCQGRVVVTSATKLRPPWPAQGHRPFLFTLVKPAMAIWA